MRPAARVIALVGAAFLGWACGKSDDGERKEGKAAAPRAAAPAEPAAEVPPEAPDPGTAGAASPSDEERATADKAALVLE